MAQEYLVPHGDGEGEYVEKHSRFLGHLKKVETEEEAVAHIKACREKYWDANHNTYAYIIRENGIMRYSDDGEPQGTAGMPILEVLRREGIQGVCCVVTRYFGGILLGAGGLTRAYGKTAKYSLDAAGIDLMRLWAQLEIKVPYNQFELVRRHLESLEALEESVDYGAEVRIEALVAAPRFEELEASLVDLTAGRVHARKTGETYRGVQVR